MKYDTYDRTLIQQICMITHRIQNFANIVNDSVMLEDTTGNTLYNIGRLEECITQVSLLVDQLLESTIESNETIEEIYEDVFSSEDEDDELYDLPVGTPIDFRSKSVPEDEVFYSTSTKDGTSYHDPVTGQNCEYDSKRQVWFCTDDEEYPDAK